MSSPTVFVVAATGTVGGAVARHLISINWNVHATSRDPDSPAAKSLQALGVKLFKGSWDDEDVLEAALAGCSALFLNPVPGLDDPGAELRRAKLILATGKAAGVKHVVFSSLLGTPNPEKMKDFDPNLFAGKVVASKQKIEDALRTSGFDSWTILRPGIFMAMFLLPKVRMYSGLVETNRWTTSLQPDSHMPLIDERDIAAFAVASMQDPVRFHGREINLAGDLLYPDEIMATLSRATGRDIKAVFMTDEEVEAQKENPMVGGYLAMREFYKYVDIDEVKSWGLPIGTFEAYLEREKDAVKKSFPPAA